MGFWILKSLSFFSAIFLWMVPVTAQQKTVVVIDSYSSGRLLTLELQQQGYRVIHYHSRAKGLVNEYDAKSFVESDFVPGENFYHEGELDPAAVSKTATEILENYNPIAVIAGAETGVMLADALSEALNLASSNGTALSDARRDKYLMQETIAKAGLRHIRQIEGSELESFMRAFRDSGIKFPVVVKPPSSAGQEGYHVCHTEDEVKSAFYRINGKLNGLGLINEKVLLQEFVTGTEFAVNTVSKNGVHKVTDIWEYRAESTYRYHWLLDAHGPFQRFLLSYAEQVLDALGVKNGPSHMELKLRELESGDYEVVLIETGARLMGTMAPELVRIATGGPNQVDATIDAYDPERSSAFDSRPKLYKKEKHAVHFYLNSKGDGGRYSEKRLQALLKLPAVRAVDGHYQDGDRLAKTIDADTIVGRIYIAHEDLEVVQRTLATILKMEDKGYLEKHPGVKGVVGKLCSTELGLLSFFHNLQPAY